MPSLNHLTTTILPPLLIAMASMNALAPSSVGDRHNLVQGHGSINCWWPRLLTTPRQATAQNTTLRQATPSHCMVRQTMPSYGTTRYATAQPCHCIVRQATAQRCHAKLCQAAARHATTIPMHCTQSYATPRYGTYMPSCTKPRVVICKVGTKRLRLEMMNKMINRKK